mgnify:CR=1 FL=1
MNVNATSRMRDTAHAEGHESFGHLVAPGINAPNHQHFFSYRLDLDVDGSANTVFETETHAAPAATNPKGELFAMGEHPLVGGARRDAGRLIRDRARVAHREHARDERARPVHRVHVGARTRRRRRSALAESAPMRTAGFIAHQLWVTPYSPDELYAAGEFQNLGRDSEGLPTWTRANRSLADTDVVLWYTLGITHIPRAGGLAVHAGAPRRVSPGADVVLRAQSHARRAAGAPMTPSVRDQGSIHSR